MQTYTVIFQLITEVKPEFADAYRIADCFPRGVIRDFTVFDGRYRIDPRPVDDPKPEARFKNAREVYLYIMSWLPADFSANREQCAAWVEYFRINGPLDPSVRAADAFIEKMGG